MTLQIDNFNDKPGIVILSATMTEAPDVEGFTLGIITTGIVTTIEELERAIAEYKEKTA